MIYLDYAASTPLHPLLQEKLSYAYSFEGNAQSSQMTHIHKMIEKSKQNICTYFDGDPSRLFFTSGSTESISTAIIGASRFYKSSGSHIITFATEHHAVLEAMHALQTEGFTVTVLPVQKNGTIDIALLKSHITKETILISINGLCNETGLIQDLKPFIQIKNDYGLMIHLDASQMIGKVAFSLKEIPVDFMSISSHKCYGPQGIGGLYIAKGRHIQPLIRGNHAIRSGTISNALIYLMGEAYNLAKQDIQTHTAYIKMLREHFLNGLNTIDYTVLSDGAESILTLHFNQATEADIAEIRKGIYCQISASCSSGISHVLLQRLSYQEALQCIRFSFGFMTTVADTDQSVLLIKKVLS